MASTTADTNSSVYTPSVDGEKGDMLHNETARKGPSALHNASRLAAVQEGDDEVARKIFAAHADEAEWTEAEEKKTVRKIDILLLPIMMFTIGLQLTDKGIYGAACTNGMCADLGLYEPQIGPNGTMINNTKRYSFASMIFYVGYICGIYPLAWLCQKLPTAKVTSIYTIIWGLIVILQIVCTNYQGAYAQRFFLGFMESGISPAFALITSMFYTKREQAFRLPLWYAGGFFVLANSQFVTWAFSNITDGALSAWKLIFLFWGLLTMAWGVFAWFVLPSSQEKAIWLSERERYISIARLRNDQDSVKSKHIKVNQLIELLTDVRAWCIMIITFCILPPNGLTGTFIPVVVQGLGFSKHDSILLTAPAHYVSTLTGWILGFACLKITNFRCIGIALCLIPCLIGDVMLWQIPRSNTAASLAAIFMNSSFAGALTQVQALVPSNNAGTTKKLFLSASTYLAYCLGNIAGPLFLKGKEAPYYPSAFKANTVILCLAYLFIFIYWFSARRENKKRDAMGDAGHVDHAFEDLTDIQNKAFRYKL